jgi:hypothetical protein
MIPACGASIVLHFLSGPFLESPPTLLAGADEVIE